MKVSILNDTKDCQQPTHPLELYQFHLYYLRLIHRLHHLHHCHHQHHPSRDGDDDDGGGDDDGDDLKEFVLNLRHPDPQCVCQGGSQSTKITPDQAHPV